MSQRNIWLWCLLAWLWGSSFLAMGIGVQTLAPEVLVAMRMVVGAVLLISLLLYTGGSLRLGARGWALAAVVGLTGNVFPFLLITAAGRSVETGLAALIMGLAPILTLTLAPLAHRSETLTPAKVIGALLGLGGVLLIVGPDVVNGLGERLLPQAGLLLAAAFYSFTALFSRRFPYDNPIQMAAASVLVGAASISVYVSLFSAWPPLGSLNAGAVTAGVYLGIGATALAALIYFYLIPRIGAGRLQQVNYVVPLIGTLLGAAILAERLPINAIAAIPIIFLAIYLVMRPTRVPAGNSLKAP